MIGILELLKMIFKANGGFCTTNGDTSNCNASGFSSTANSSGYVSAYENNNPCTITYYGYTQCFL